MRNATVLNAILYQLGWLACVVGGNAWALALGGVCLVLHWRLVDRSAHAWSFIAVAALLGLAMDIGWQRLGLIEFNDVSIGSVPPWLGMLWLLFASTLMHSLAWLQTRLWLAAVLGGVAGPLSYVAGLELGAASSAMPHWQVGLAMAPGWMLLLPLLAYLARHWATRAGAGGAAQQAAPLLLLLALPLAAGQAEAQPLERIEGTAVELPARRELYRELHEIGPLAHRIEYRSPDGTLIAQKSLDYACSESAPAFEQRDLRRGTRIGARWEDGEYLLLRDEESRALARSGPLVASSGFDRYVRAHWDALLAGDRVEAEFALPARLQSLRLRIDRIEAPERLPGAGLWLRIVPAQAWLRAFVDPIELAYGADRQLLLYRGLSNLVDAEGKSQLVEIRYRRIDATESREIAASTGAAAEPGAEGLRTSAQSQCTGEQS